MPSGATFLDIIADGMSRHPYKKGKEAVDPLRWKGAENIDEEEKRRRSASPPAHAKVVDQLFAEADFIDPKNSNIANEGDASPAEQPCRAKNGRLASDSARASVSHSLTHLRVNAKTCSQEIVAHYVSPSSFEGHGTSVSGSVKSAAIAFGPCGLTPVISGEMTCP